ncbi:FlhB domain-containing protein [Thermocrinis albus DSM 14484]|uniref:FlhB domain-containing protein n=1 Tax=Thermocrinis albus (strain DSM 14484 / JCM 11386 / HI 11/12) TaxID=638303 RepID=D3SNI5_THEAH|nr:EscU/YscU/HrcU family type III secretion system export apparatus switch protein [Thermocrinis albus]ADC88722.1 FlhB domain-containing protein [Thermocrinis albus DSM 14484]
MERKKAVALRYHQEKDRAPVVVAKGMGDVAEKILQLAKEYGVPVVEDPQLVTALMGVELLEEIPPRLYRAVAQILLFVRKVTQQKGS